MMRIKQGAEWGRTWPFQVDGVPVTDFTGWSAKAQVRSSADSDTVLWEWSTNPGTGQGTATLSDSAVTLSHHGEDSSPWAWRSGVYDVRVTDNQGREAFVYEGRVMVIPAVTRD